MNRKKRTEILIKGSGDTAAKLAKEILHTYDVTIVEESHNGLVMIKMRESAQHSLFYLGEVLITECKVMIKDNLGIGMVMGHEPIFARYLAVIDAAYNSDLPETRQWIDLLGAEEKRLKEEYVTLDNTILKTKVKFDTMDV